MEGIILQKGLTSGEAREFLKKYGLNEIKEAKKFVLLKSFILQFNSFLVLLLVSAALVSFFIGDKIDAAFISLIVVLNAFFGFYQEYKAEKALKLLKKLTTATVRVVRDGEEQELDNRYLVPGDIIYLEQGAKVPADAQLLKSWHLEVNEAALSGESFPVEKNAQNEDKRNIYLGTIITAGRCYAKVLRTGEATRFGQVAKTLSQIEERKTPLQKRLEVFTKQIGIVGILASLVVFVLSFIQEKTLVESFIFAVSLAVAAVPEGLPGVMTITLAMGVERMAKKKAIVRKLSAVEALGSVTLLATDKTGTLTANKMCVKKIWVGRKEYDIDNPPTLASNPFSKLVLNGVLCSTASIVFKVDHGAFDVLGDATEGAMLLLGQQVGLIPEVVKSEWRLTEEVPFDPVTKRMSVAVTKGKEAYVFTKGAPESVISICNKIMVGEKELRLTEEERSLIEKEFRGFAKKGLRVIAFSYKDRKTENIEKDQIFLGFVGIADPVRNEVKEAVQKAHQAGIKVIMITGDSELTAEAVGIETGIIKKGEDILTGKQLDGFSDEQLLAILPNVRIFARTSPEHKHKLVRLFQKQNEIVAVMGDGVNDALALKEADVGVAMGLTGTDVAKEIADIIITDDNFASLVSAVEEGRDIFNHIRNVIKFLLACNLGEVLYILMALVFRLPILTSLQILYVNLVTDGLPAISFAFSPHDGELMLQKPKKVKGILNLTDFKYVLFTGVLTAFVGLLSVIPFITSDGFKVGSTILFTSIILIQHFILTDSWLSHKPIFKNIKSLMNPVFLLAFFLPIIIHPTLLYQPFLSKVFSTNPLSFTQMLWAVAASVIALILIEVVKVIKKNRLRAVF